jgi:hypothetical protein
MKREIAKRKIIKGIRLNETESEQIKYCAQRCGLSPATFIRECALKHNPRGKDMTRLVNEISKQGGLIKHLHTQGLGHSELTAQILRDMQKTIKEISRAAVRGKEEAAGED